MKDILMRLQRLEAAYQVRQGGLTVSRLPHRPLSHTKEPPPTPLWNIGVDTGAGKIIDLMDPEGECDPITSAVYDDIREIIAGGGNSGN